MSNPNLLGTLYKLPTETYHPSVDFSEWLAAGDTVTSATVTCAYGATDYSSSMIATVTDDNDDHVTWELKAGTAGQTYLITVTATTTNSDVWVALLNLVVN
jgi:hypothetical protein